jgi:hypothetical protein
MFTMTSEEESRIRVLSKLIAEEREPAILKALAAELDHLLSMRVMEIKSQLDKPR